MKTAYSLKKANDVLDVCQKIVTIFAVIIGGFWTWKLFAEHREGYTKANISHHVACIRVSDDAKLIRVNVIIKNSGKKVLRLTRGEVHLRHILPLRPVVLKEWKDAENNVTEGEERFSWSLIQKRRPIWMPGQLLIEPDEIHNLDFEFFVSSEHEVVDVYTWFTDEGKREAGQPIGWDQLTLIDLRKQEVCK